MGTVLGTAEEKSPSLDYVTPIGFGSIAPDKIKNIQEISPEDYARKTSFTVPLAMAWSQWKDTEGREWHFLLFITEDGKNGPVGYGVGYYYEFMKARARFIKFGCHHNWRQLTDEEFKRGGVRKPTSPCETVHICDTCHTVQFTDSSD